MKNFVFGTDEYFESIKDVLEDGLCHVYYCKFPSSFSKEEGRIGFEWESRTNTYAVYIDKGISCSKHTSYIYKAWLENGIVRFLDFYDVQCFFRKMKFLYK